MIRRIAPVYAIVARNVPAIDFRCAPSPTADLGKYSDELLDTCVFVEDADAPWNCREFGVKDYDGQLLAFGAEIRHA